MWNQKMLCYLLTIGAHQRQTCWYQLCNNSDISLLGWTLPKMRIASKKASNKSCSKLNFVQKSPREKPVPDIGHPSVRKKNHMPHYTIVHSYCRYCLLSLLQSSCTSSNESSYGLSYDDTCNFFSHRRCLISSTVF